MKIVTEVVSFTVPQLVEVAKRIRTALVTELITQGVPMETYNTDGEVVKGLSPYQEQISDSMIQAGLEGNAEIGWLLTRQSGKTESAIISLLTLVVMYLSVLRKSYAVGIFAPARSQAIEVDRERLRDRTAQLSEYFAECGIRTDPTIGKTTKNFYFYSGKLTFRCRMESADPEANIKGSTLNLILLEQAEDVDQSKLKNDILPMGAAVSGSVVYSGTPSLGINNPYFYDLCTKRGKLGVNFFRVDWQEASKWRPGYVEYVKGQLERMGEDDPAFQAQYALVWIPGLAKFTSVDELNKHYMSYAPDFVYKRRALGVDWAKQKDDTYAAVLEQCTDPTHLDRHGKTGSHLHLLALHEEHGVDYSDQMPRVVDFAKFWKVTKTCDDAVGVGDPLNEQLTIFLRGISSVNGLDMTGTTITDGVSKLFQREYQDGRIWFPTPETFDSEAYVKLMPKEERAMQKRYLKKFINQILDLDREYRSSKVNLHHPEGDEYHDDSCKAVMYSTYASVGLVNVSPPNSAYVTLETQPKKARDEEQEQARELAREMEKPISQWNDL